MVEEPLPHVLLASADARGLVASVRAVVERESGHEAAGSVTFCNLLDARKPRRAAARGRQRTRRCDLGSGGTRVGDRERETLELAAGWRREVLGHDHRATKALARATITMSPAARRGQLPGDYDLRTGYAC